MIQPFSFYNRTRGTFDSDGNYNSLPDDDKKYQFQQQLFLQYGLTDRFEIDGQVVYQENFAQQGGGDAHSNGFGDSYLSVAPGIGWSCDKIQTLLTYTRTLTGTNTDANDSVVFTLVYTF